MITSYYVSKDGETNGPLTISQLRSMWSQGRLTLTHQVSVNDVDSWSPITSILPELESGEQSNAGCEVPPSSGQSQGTRRGVYIFLAIFLGMLGVHNFYAGRLGEGAACLIVSMIGWLLIQAHESIAFVGVIMLIGVGLSIIVQATSTVSDGSGRSMV